MDIDLREVIKFIDPRGLDYQDWLAVGMGLQASGYTVQDWDEWSRQDSTRYHSGECMRKWSGFGGNGGAPVTGGTIVQMAKDRGWRGSFPDDGGRELDWDDIIGGKGLCPSRQARQKIPPNVHDTFPRLDCFTGNHDTRRVLRESQSARIRRNANRVFPLVKICECLKPCEVSR